MHPSLLLQPRANSPSWPAEPPQPANGADAAVALPATPPGTPATGDNSGGSVVAPAPSSYLSQESCQQASRDGFISAAGYTVGASLVGIVIFVVMRKKLWGNAFGRYLAALGVACALGATMAGLDPVRADILEQCMHSADFSQYVFLGSQLFARALVLGLLPTLVVTFVGCFVISKSR